MIRLCPPRGFDGGQLTVLYPAPDRCQGYPEIGGYVLGLKIRGRAHNFTSPWVIKNVISGNYRPVKGILLAGM